MRQSEFKQWCEGLSEDVYNAVFGLLEMEPDINGMEAGRIATAVQRAFLVAFNSDGPPYQKELFADASD